jgi:hypothetical protein
MIHKNLLYCFKTSEALCWFEMGCYDTDLSMLRIPQLDLPQKLQYQAIDQLVLKLRTLHPLRNTLKLAVWMLSGIPSQQEAFLMNQLQSFVDPGQLVPKSNIREFGRNGLAGVVKNRLVYFNHL